MDSSTRKEPRTAARVAASGVFAAVMILSFGACSFHSLATDPLPFSDAYWAVVDLPVLYAESRGWTGDDGFEVWDARVFGRREADSSPLPDASVFLASDAQAEFPVGLRIRGQSSSGMPKRSFGLETRDSLSPSVRMNMSLFGLPEENDFVLHAAYSDKSLMRNHLTYALSAATGGWAPRTRFIELWGGQLGGDSATNYQGIYLLTEKIKVDSRRVAVTRLMPDEASEPEVSGGYLFKIDKWGSSEWMVSDVSTVNLSVVTPDAEALSLAQKNWVVSWFQGLEAAMSAANANDPVHGWRAWVDGASFIDFLLVNEITRNIDGYRISTFMHKERGGRLKAGPVWDFDIALGNADYYDGENPDVYPDSPGTERNETALGWMICLQLEPWWSDFQPAWWWRTLLRDPSFRAEARARWRALRKGPWSNGAIAAVIADAERRISPALVREFSRWDRLRSQDWPNPWPIPWNAKDPSAYEYADHLGYLKEWLTRRIAWMDSDAAWAALDDWAEEGE